MSLLARLAGCKFNRWRSWKIALYMLIACPLLATPVTSFAQSCGVTPASWVYFYDNWDLEGTAPTASEACAAFLGNTWSIGSNNLSTVVSSVVNAGSIGLPGPGAHAGCSQVFVSTNYPNPGQPINIGLTPQHGSCPNFFVVATPPRRAEVSCKNCVSDPIDPGIGNVYKTEEDVSVANSNSGIAFRRFYNSADTFGADGVLGWRRSYGRSVSTVYQTASSPYPGQSAIVSAEYGTPQDACVQGFLAIRASVGAWQSATATYTNGVCVLSIATGTIGTLQIQLDTPMAPPASPIEYDLVRDDGQVLRYTLQNGTINNPPGSSMQLAVTSSGFTATDDQDNIERYDSNGVLQSITGRAGVVQTVSYDSNGLFNGVTDSFGNSLTATRNTQGSIATVAINGGGAVQYSYDSAGRLTTVINQDNTTKRYTYGGPIRCWLLPLTRTGQPIQPGHTTPKNRRRTRQSRAAPMQRLLHTIRMARPPSRTRSEPCGLSVIRA